MLARLRTARSTSGLGASAVEYGLLVAAIAAALVLVVFLLGDAVVDVFRDSCPEAVEEGTAVDGQTC